MGDMEDEGELGGETHPIHWRREVTVSAISIGKTLVIGLLGNTYAHNGAQVIAAGKEGNTEEDPVPHIGLIGLLARALRLSPLEVG